MGDLPARTLVTTRIVECCIHTRDVATALGVDGVPAPGGRLRHIARLAWRTLPHAFSRAGLPPLDVDSVHLTLAAPDGDTWTFGSPDAPTTVAGAHVGLTPMRERAEQLGGTFRAGGGCVEVLLPL